MKNANKAMTLLVLIPFTFATLAPPVSADTVRQSDRIRTNQVQPGQEIIIDLHDGLGKDVKGRYVSSGKEGITVRLKDGADQVIPWDSVRVIKAKNAGHGLWLGLAAGAAIAGAALAADGGETDGPWAAAFVSIGAGLGCLEAATVSPNEPPYYKAPKAEDPDRETPKPGQPQF